MFTTCLDEQDNGRAIWLGQDKRNREWVYEVTVKVPGGVRHLVFRQKRRPTEAACIECALQHGNFSTRPYQPGQACDGSIDSVALTLYFRFCEANQIDALALLRTAYPEENDWDKATRAKILARGEWEGVAVPEKWDEAAIAGTLESLTEITQESPTWATDSGPVHSAMQSTNCRLSNRLLSNYHSLRSTLDDLLEERAQAGTVQA